MSAGRARQLSPFPVTGVDAVFLDNMDSQALRKVVQDADGRAMADASGGTTLEKIREIAGTDVHLGSIGALTHSAPVVDLSLEID